MIFFFILRLNFFTFSDKINNFSLSGILLQSKTRIMVMYNSNENNEHLYLYRPDMH